MIGSIPQQDVFQRVMSAKDADTSVKGPIIGGISYMVFAMVPIFIGLSAFLVMPEAANALLKEDSQKILPTLVMEHMPVWLQVAFFGALLAAIMSTASATLLAPSTTFVENVLKNFVKMNDKQELLYMRLTVVVFTACVLIYSIIMIGTPIYELVSKAYQFPVVGAFWPLVCGLYWRRSTTQGAICVDRPRPGHVGTTRTHAARATVPAGAWRISDGRSRNVRRLAVNGADCRALKLPSRRALP